MSSYIFRDNLSGCQRYLPKKTGTSGVTTRPPQASETAESSLEDGASWGERVVLLYGFMSIASGGR
jgi:hypothetical protein